MSDVTALKRAAGERAASWVESGMVVGLGTGSTAVWAVRKIGALLASGALERIVAVPTSRETAAVAQRLGIELASETIPSVIDLTIDGADEVDPVLDLVKGGGGALLREKIVAQASRREVIVVDSSKVVERLGSTRPLPVEVVAFGLDAHRRFLEGLGGRPVLRLDGTEPFRTDSGNVIFDCDFGPIGDAPTLAAELAGHAGIVEHGLFLGLTAALVVAGPNGLDVRERKSPKTRSLNT
jgi:ribose 5-phosphate isomerase A